MHTIYSDVVRSVVCKGETPDDAGDLEGVVKLRYVCEIERKGERERERERERESVCVCVKSRCV